MIVSFVDEEYRLFVLVCQNKLDETSSISFQSSASDCSSSSKRDRSTSAIIPFNIAYSSSAKQQKIYWSGICILYALCERIFSTVPCMSIFPDSSKRWMLISMVINVPIQWLKYYCQFLMIILKWITNQFYQFQHYNGQLSADLTDGRSIGLFSDIAFDNHVPCSGSPTLIPMIVVHLWNGSNQLRDQ